MKHIGQVQNSREVNTNKHLYTRRHTGNSRQWTQPRQNENKIHTKRKEVANPAVTGKKI